MKFHSPYLALVFRKDVPQITYLGVESGGRSRRHLDRNLQKPGYGGEILSGHPLSTSKEVDGKMTGYGWETGVYAGWISSDGRPCGYNYLADNYVFLLTAIQGYFGVELPKLSDSSRKRINENVR